MNVSNHSNSIADNVLGDLELDLLDDDDFLKALLDDGDNIYNLNAVHMYTQENAKIPSINFAVDRKQPVKKNRDGSPILSGAVMTEKLLNVGKRSNADLAYAASGVLSTEVHSTVRGKASKSVVSSSSSSSLQNESSDSVSSNLIAVIETETGSNESEGVDRNEPVDFEQKQRQSKNSESQPVPPMHIDSTAVAIAAAAAAASTFGQTSSFPIMRSYPLPIPVLLNGEGSFSKEKSSDVLKNKRLFPSPKMPLRLDASRQKTGNSISANQFGFGKNHVVPSIPRPPVPNTIQKRNSSTRKSSLEAKKGQKSSGREESSTAANEAYERKKQRAKEGRVKLNEAIDNLSIQMSLAGSESLKRSRNHATVNPQRSTLDAMALCIKVADGAKKWDRPSFIGAAAQMIGSLNSQCEALSNELHRMKMFTKNSNQASSNRLRKDTQSSYTRQYQPSSTDCKPTSKRQKVEIISDQSAKIRNQDNFRNIFDHKSVLITIFSFLTPRCVARCSRASKYCQALNTNDVWRQFCFDRFGYGNDNGVESSCVASIDLYRKLHLANPIPEIQGIPKNCMCIGRQRSYGVNSWLYIVKRSNGYLNSSVKVKGKEDGGIDRYTSLPVVDLIVLVQNVNALEVKFPVRQVFTIDASTRRSDRNMLEIQTDERYCRSAVVNRIRRRAKSFDSEKDRSLSCSLDLFDAAAIFTYVHAKGCSTIDSFIAKANFLKVLVEIDNKTLLLTVPIANIEGDNAPNA